MIERENNNYNGLMPDELPHGLSNEDICSSLIAFTEKGEKNLYITWRGSLSEMGCIQKVFIYILHFFGFTSCIQNENLQYQFLKILYIANSQDLIKGDVDEAFTNSQIEGLLLGVSEAISLRNRKNCLKSSLFKFSKNHTIKPAFFHSLLVSTLPLNLHEKDKDFGITYLHYASQISGFCTSHIEQEIQNALDCVDLDQMPSDKFCIKFVEIIRNYPKAFESIKFDQEKLNKIDMILDGAFLAFASVQRYHEATACVEELRPRLLQQDEVSQENYAQLALLYTSTDMLKAKEFLGKCNFDDLTFLTKLHPTERTTFLLFLLQSIAENFSLELFEKKHVNDILRNNLKELVRTSPTELGNVLTLFCQHTLRDELNDLQAQATENGFASVLLAWNEKSSAPEFSDNPKQISAVIISRAMEYFLHFHGFDSLEAVQMAENLGLLLENTPEDHYLIKLMDFSEGLPRAQILGYTLCKNQETKEFGQKILSQLEGQTRSRADNTITLLSIDPQIIADMEYRSVPMTYLRQANTT